ncbi:RPA family protein [Halorussus sp. MSC15.2]|uniref:RPA family protein n=1 Tax=Halorussus sp. MSC15.2 TaxID=2283638 RepID=UPI0013D6509E|nr:DNA-binding protein [Halorussus sp. MSC15.2]NEU58448.1 DNA-binding protein [Halorussus sp. MSC15.2]
MSETPTREVARRVFAGEFNDATHTFKESEEERAPVYVLLPTGVRANRIFVVGTLTETEDVGEDSEYWQGRVVDPNGDPFFVYAGQYQPEAASMLRELEPPAYVAITGKPRTYETDDGNTNVSVRPESITLVDAATRDRWVVETAEQTLDRIESFDDETNEYARMAEAEYDLPLDRYHELVISALESLEGESDGESDAGDPVTDDGADDADDAGTEPEAEPQP